MQYDAFLEELLLRGSPRSTAPAPSQLARTSMELPRKRGGRRNKIPDYPLNAPSTVVRQALIPNGPGSYPSQVTALHNVPEGRQQKASRQQSDNWAVRFSNAHKWREMGWNTSSPAEYLLQANSQDFKQTLAYAEDYMQRQELLNSTDFSTGVGACKSPANTFSKAGYFPRSISFSNTTTTASTRGIAEVGSAQSEEERTLLKNTMLREGLLVKLHDLIKTARPPQSLLQPHVPPKEPVFDVSKGTEVLHVLLQLRDVGILVVENILRWHELRVRLAPMAPLLPFRFENYNYCVKMLSDLNFLSTIKSLGTVLGVNPSTMKQNPFMMPAPIPERDFKGLRDKPWRSLRLFTSSDDPVQRVADAERYLVWCLSNLQDLPVPASPSPARCGTKGLSPTSLIQQQKRTWQQRAEKQLEMLSMPLESLSGPTYTQDSSKMMKRKGVLPSLPQSPPKTLRELMGSAHQNGCQEEDYGRGDNNRIMILRACWKGEEFAANAADFKALGALDAPPHHMVTLVAASVLILLSPADQLPKDLSWPSCQKMLRRGECLIQRVQVFDVAEVPAFKWKALVPFLQNEHFQPKFLSQFSCAASSMCAWIFSVLRAAQQQDYARLGLHTSGELDAVGEEDRLELLSELEVDAASIPSAKSCPSLWEPTEENESQLPPLSRSKSGKRVSIGSAEVLFINENQPVKMICSLYSSGPSNALLRTSPWTYRGVVYFVSFFLQERSQQEEEAIEETEERRLMIKIYEPMSSVESQMSVDTEDLRQDFGVKALVAFQSGQYRTLCDVMLRQLDKMMGADSRKLSLVTPLERNGGKRKQESVLDLLLQDSESDHGQEERPEVVDESAAEDAPQSLEPETTLELDELDASVLKIQCAARQQQARGKVNRARAQKEQMEASALRIQCAARQKQACRKVDRVRAEKTMIEAVPEGEELQADSEEFATDEVEQQLENVVVPESRPGTVMSYASDQFEDDFEAA
ncbi:Microtubule-binding stalk of dynein motor domain-containing protein [Phytophthora infestans]|uniref:Microtubule-binding stalk of dynein motor domain-containing protein n=1 Tax=Phytophthora infestans TaxID=4787 RepID=A0A833S6I5_PHYIN|nr:Microtubule-binding stalk of dynein motor domain-containing protein [Phytophthora infestans]